VRLAVSLFLPEGAEEGRAAPVVLEALPYRKDDATAPYRPEYERLCAEYGYAVAGRTCGGRGRQSGWPPTSTRRLSRRPVPGDRLAGLTVVVDRIGRDVRDELLGVAGCSLESSQTCANVRAREWGSRGQVGEEPVPPSG
jgi:hypothetical protein